MDGGEDSRLALAMRDLLKQGSLLFAGQVAVIALNLVTGILLARGLGPDGRGAYAAVIVWPHVAAWIATLWLTRATAYHRAKDPTCERALVANGTLMGLLLGSIVTIVGAMILPVLLRQHDAGVIRIGELALLLVPVVAMSDILEWVFRGAGAFAIMACIRVAGAMLQCGGVVMLFLTARMDVWRVVLVWAVGSTIILGLQLTILWARGGLSFRPDRTLLRQSAVYGARAFPAALAELGLQSIDQVVLVPVLSPAALGIYTISSRAMLLVQLPWALSQVLFTSLARRTAQQGFALAVRVIVTGAAITGVAAGLLAFFAGPIIQTLYGEAFSPAVGPFRVLLVGALAMGMTRLVGEALAGMGRPGLNSLGQAIAVVLMVVLLWEAVSRFGLMGGAWAVTLAHWGSFLLLLSLLRMTWASIGHPRVAGR